MHFKFMDFNLFFYKYRSHFDFGASRVKIINNLKILEIIFIPTKHTGQVRREYSYCNQFICGTTIILVRLQYYIYVENILFLW